MRTYTKKLLRDLLTGKAQLIAIIVVVGLGVTLFTGIFTGSRSLGDSVDSFYSKTAYEDFSVTVVSVPPEVVIEAEKLKNVEAAQGRLVVETLGRVKDTSLTIRVVTVPDGERPGVSGLEVEEGDYLGSENKGSCLAEYHLAEEFNIGPGDTIGLKGDRGQTDFLITGVVASPEYLRLARGRTELVTDPRQFGVVFLKFGDALRLFDYPEQYNEVLFKVSDPGQIESTIRSAESLLAPFNIIAVTMGEERMSASMMKLDAQNQQSMALFFGPLFLVVAALTLFVSITRQVVLQQRQIGISRALGYGKKSVLFHYMGYGAVPGFIGSCLGIIGGYFMGKWILGVLLGALGVPPIYNSHVYWDIALLGAATGILFSMLGAILPALRAANMRPEESIRTEADISHRYKRRSVNKQESGAAAIPAWLYLSFRNIGQNWRRVTLTFLSITMTVAMLIALSAGLDSVGYSFDKHMNEVLKWDVMAVFQEPQTAKLLTEIKGIDGIREIEPGAVFPARILSADGSADIEMQALSRGTVMHRDLAYGDSQRWPGPGEIVLHKGVSQKLGVRTGDTVSIKTEIGTVRAEVTGFVNEIFGNVGYMDLGYIRDLAGVDIFNTVLLKIDPSGQDDVLDSLGRTPGIARMITMDQMRGYGETIAGVISSFGNILLVMGFIIGFSIVFTMVTINVLERSRELATMRTLGAGGGVIFGSLSVETLLICIAAFVPGVLIGRVLEWVLIEKTLSTDFISATSILHVVTVLIILAGLLAAAFLSELLPYRWIMKLDLAKATRERRG
ncbi:MAG: FtsX-like permease family protein [Actinobacteria bacterium]|nr:FtsX-like permease family protein [Actinomycetota bacterium]